MSIPDPRSTTLHIVRTFPCTVDRLWRAWADWENMLSWWGPVDWPAVEVAADFRVGGQWRAELQSASGESLHQSGTFLDIDAPRRLVFTFRWDGDNHEDGPGVETRVVVELSEVPDGTSMRFEQFALASEESARGHEGGWQSTFDRLATCLSGEDAV